MQVFYSQFLLLGKRLLLILLLFFLGRLYFYLYNIHYFVAAWPGEVLKSFLYGIHFDISAIIYLNLPFILLHLIPVNFVSTRPGEIILKFYFFLVNGVLVFSTLMDSEYFRFTGKRTSSDFFSYMVISDDLANLIPRFIYDYWYILFIWFLLMIVAWKIYPLKDRNIIKESSFSPGGIIAHYFAALLAAAFLISLARGYRLKPLRVITASNYVSPANIPLILNTPFTIMKSFNKKQLTIPAYLTMESAESIFSPLHELPGKGRIKNTNVVLIIMESFSSEHSGFLTGSTGHMPFLDSLMQHSLLFTNAFANAKKSIESLPAILASIPALMDTPYVSSPYSSNTINSLPGKLRELGYHTSFFHGGINGTMGFDNFAKVAGVERYFGRNEFGNDSYHDGYWGIFDEEFFQFFAGKLNTFSQPFFSCLFSLSSHYPYIIPEKHREAFPRGPDPILASISYADYSLRKFFDTVKHEPWFENTLFVITADHTAQSYQPYHQNRVGDYSIPMVYYHPGDPGLQGRNDRLTQHIDIMPSVLDYLDTGSRFISFGTSVFSNQDNGFVINYLNGLYQLMEDDRIIFFDGKICTGLYNFRQDSLLGNNYLEYHALPDHSEMMLEKLKSIIQQYNYRLLKNKMRPE
jgi:phosphoglycerol transferase MdoB-like AlkP superfamily enzyme